MIIDPGKSEFGRLRVPQGEVFFECAGTTEPVVFLHGFGLDARMWAPQYEAFQSSYRVIRYDLRGFGRSSLPPTSQYAHEDDLRDLLLHLGVTSAHVVGLSMGGMMGLRFALAHPGMVQSLVLAGSALDGFAWSADWQGRWKAIRDSARAGLMAEAKRQWAEHPLFGPVRTIPSSAPLLSAMIEHYSGWHWREKDMAKTPSPPLAERLQEISPRSLVITGSRDIPDFQAIGKLLAAGLPRAQREIIEGSGHMVNLEAPELFNAILWDFWRGLKAR